MVLYLEAIDLSNKQILQILKKKPSLPDYDQLPWVMDVIKDMAITRKLKSKARLNQEEKIRLKNILEVALNGLRKLNRMQRIKREVTGLEVYMDKFLSHS